MQEKNVRLDTPVRYFKGVGPKKSDLLSRLGVSSASDLLYYLPARYEDRSKCVAIKDVKPGEYQTVRGKVLISGGRTTRSGQQMFQIAVEDGTGIIDAVWFNQPYLRDCFRKGQDLVLYGKAEIYDGLKIIQPEYEILQEEGLDSVNIGRIVPVYPATKGLAQRYLRSLVFDTLKQCSRAITDNLPTNIRARHKLVDARFALNNIHFPSSFENLDRAYRRIVFEEFFMLQIMLALKKGCMKSGTGRGHKTEGGLVKSFLGSIPFELTAGQNKAMSDIDKDISSGRAMNRLIEGDVGSGKTIVAAYAITIAVQNGFQAALMAPTEVLARQHYIVLSELLMPLGINVALLIGGIAKADRERICSDIRSGSVDIVIGTHAVVQEDVVFKDLALAIIDEQHKFGVSHRAALKAKGQNPHMMVMTATPIPRTLALTVYGDLDISVIRELPKGRKGIVTYWIEQDRRRAAYDFVKDQIAKGRQAYVVCPLIKSSEFGVRSSEVTGGGRGAVDTFEKLKNEIFPGYTVGLLHGRMSSKEKDRIMKSFKKGDIDVLVSTVVIEVGIDVANASVMLIENAERFGLAQLHQLRGRVGRGRHGSYCILLADPKTESSAQRVRSIAATQDGFEIAEADLDIRGPGEFFGTRQHGLPEMRFGDLVKDFDIMELARKEAFDMVARDPALKEESHIPVKAALASRFKSKLVMAGVA
jgi:ATP-dependent DNA helicase RecG